MFLHHSPYPVCTHYTRNDDDDNNNNLIDRRKKNAYNNFTKIIANAQIFESVLNIV